MLNGNIIVVRDFEKCSYILEQVLTGINKLPECMLAGCHHQQPSIQLSIRTANSVLHSTCCMAHLCQFPFCCNWSPNNQSITVTS